MKEQIGQQKIFNVTPLTNFEIQQYYQNEPEFNSVYSKSKLSKIKVWTYIRNIDDFESAGTHWIDLHVNDK